MRKREEKYLNAITRIEELSIQLYENPNDPILLEHIADAEDSLCELIKENESEVEMLLGMDSEDDENDYYNSRYDATEI